MTTTAICSAASGPCIEMLQVAEPSIRAYADRWGMDAHLNLDLVCGRPASWYKILMVARLLDSYETVVWVDADTLILRGGDNIVDHTNPMRPLWMVKHRHGDILLPNAGVLVAYRDPMLTVFFDLVWQQTQYIDHPWWEQAAILHLLGWKIEPPGGGAQPGARSRYSNLVGYLSTKWNSMVHDPHPHPAIRHYTMMPDRAAAMRADLDTMRADLEVRV